MFKATPLLRKSKQAIQDRVSPKTIPHYEKIVQWGKLLSITGSAQILVQGVGFLSGLLIIRFLPVHEYALYTLANTMLGTMYLLADGGISAGVLSQGGTVWQDKEKLGLVVGTGLKLGKRFAVVSLLFSLPVLVYLLDKHDASGTMIILISASLIPAFYAQVADSIYGVVPRLHQDITRLQKNDILVGIGRLALTASFIFIFPFTFLALLANGLPRIYGNIQLRKLAGSFARIPKKRTDPVVQRSILNTVKRMMPGLVYFCLSGQITIWLISVFGTTTELAQLGALGRLAVILTLVSGLLGTLVVPRFARLAEQKRLMFRYYLQIVAVVSVLLLTVLGGIYIFSGEILFIIGKKYAGLHWELMLTMFGSGLGLIASTAFLLNISRNWLINPLIAIPLSLASVVIGVLLFDISTLRGVLVYNIFLAVVQVGMNVFYGLFRIKQLKIGV